MKAFLLLFLTSLATGAQLYWLIMWGIWGKPPNPFEYLAGFGSLGLFLGAFVALFSLRSARIIAFASFIPLWIFYGPALFATVSAGHFHVTTLAPPFLLILSSIWMVASCLPMTEGKKEKLFPNSTSQLCRRITIGTVVGGIAAYVSVMILFTGVEKEVEAPVTWKIVEREGKEITEFVFDDFEGFNQIETSDQAVIDYVRSLNSPNTSVSVVLVYDFGKVRSMSLNYAEISGIRFRPWVE